VAATLRQAIFATRGQVLTWQGQPIHAVYHASNGGVAAGFDEGWNAAPLPYLQPQLDGPPNATRPLSLPLDQAAVISLLQRSSGFYGSEHPSFRWQRLVDANALAAALRPGAPGLGQPNRIVVLERGASGRVIALEIGGAKPGAARVVLRRDAIRRTIRQLPSTLFSVEALGPGRWRFVGGGHGHGAGLSQAGAIDLAARGWSMEGILQRYYPGSQLLPLTGLSGSDH
jgi:SpoIID/LytB domain protein